MNRSISIISIFFAVVIFYPQGLLAKNCKITHTIVSETVDPFPSNRARLKLGIGEKVKLTLSGGHKATWTIAEGGGKLTSPASGITSVTFTAPEIPSNTCKISAQCEESGAKSVDIIFSVVAPTEVKFVYIQDVIRQSEPLVYDYTARVYILPDDVNFKGVEVSERACNSNNATGYFVSASAHAAWTSWLSITSYEEGTGSLMDGVDLIGYETKNSNYSNGTLPWDIQWRYKIHSTEGDLVMVRQEFELSKMENSSKWTLTASKNYDPDLSVYDVSSSYTQE